MEDYVRILDTTLRDGEQSPGATMNIEEKIQVALQLEKLGVDAIEAGFPIASEGDFEAVRRIAERVQDSKVVALARCEKADIQRAWEAVCVAKKPGLHVFLSTSDIHLRYQLRKNREEVLQWASEMVKFARGLCQDVEFSPMDASRTDPSFLFQVLEAAIEAGATTVNIPDTVGYAIPEEFGELIRQIRSKVPNIDRAVLSVHCHNDLGLAVANSLAAVRAGARQVECTINGIGERAGNAALEEVVMALRTRADHFGLQTRVHTEFIYPTSRMVSRITGIPVQPNKAIVGANAFSHESGIHQDGILKDKRTYEIMTPESVGWGQTSLVLGKHSGRHALRDRLRKLGYDLTPEDLDRVFQRFKALADRNKDVYDEDLEAIVEDEVLRVPAKYKLSYLHVTSGSVTVPTASVKLEIDGVEHAGAGFGIGPVDATFQTISRIAKTKARLKRFAINAITGGSDAQGEVTVRLEANGHEVVGQGTHPDVIVASAKAYVNALNRLEYRKRYPIQVRKEEM
ncbi:MAG: 2-isopropylmalate synthase [Thermodesulfobacteriota bacterium]